MRAMVLQGPGDFRLIDDYPEPVAEHGDVVVEIAAVAICGTDLGYFDGTRTPPSWPWIVGHEAIGRIVTVGGGVDPERVGERVVIEPNYPCGTCRSCRRGLGALCTARRSPVLTEPGMLTERVALPAPYAWALPEPVSDRDAVCIEPLAVVLGALRRAEAADQTLKLAVLGAGSLGRILIDVLVRSGREVWTIDTDPARVDAAVEMGAHPAGEEVFDIAIDTTGSSAAGEWALSQLAPGGRLVLVGAPVTPLEVSGRLLVYRGLTVTGSFIYEHDVDFRAAVDAVVSGRATPGVFLTDPVLFADAGSAFSAARTTAGKRWILGANHES